MVLRQFRLFKDGSDGPDCSEMVQTGPPQLSRVSDVC